MEFLNNLFGGLFGAFQAPQQDETPQHLQTILMSGPDQGRAWLMRDYPYKEPHPLDDWVQTAFQNMANEAHMAEAERQARIGSSSSTVVVPDDTFLHDRRTVVPDDTFLHDQRTVVPDDTFLHRRQGKPVPPPAMKLGAGQDLRQNVNLNIKPGTETEVEVPRMGTSPNIPSSIQEAVRRSNAPNLNLRGTWTSQDPRWAALSSVQKAAVMALMEADGMKFDHAKNAAAAMVNRSMKDNQELGKHVSARIYQPTFEPAQHKRLGAILNSPKFKEMEQWITRYQAGLENDPTNGATHFLAHPRVMLALEAGEPRKYRSWRSWTGFDQRTGMYRNQTITDGSHAFLAPEGRFSAAEFIRRSIATGNR